MGRPFRVEVEAFLASQNPDRCRQYLAGHRKILEDHGFDHFITGTDYWIESPDVLVVMAYSAHDRNRIFGGLRFEKRKEDNLLPLEKVLNQIDPLVSPIIQRETPRGTGEMCGLWNAQEVGGRNISLVLATALFAAIPQTGAHSSFIFNARYTFRITRRLGFKQLDELPNNGIYKYPNDAFKAFLWQHKDLHDLKDLANLERESVASLRQNWKQERNESLYYPGMRVHYNLEI
jgi:hypothetical protein